MAGPDVSAAVYAAIVGVYTRCYRTIERGDVEGHVREFTEDCIIVFPGGHEIVGRPALTRMRTERPVVGVRHYVTNHAIEMSADESSATVTAAVLMVSPADKSIVGTGVYHTQFIKDGGRWLIKRNELSM